MSSNIKDLKSKDGRLSTATDKGLKPATDPPPMPKVNPPKSEKGKN